MFALTKNGTFALTKDGKIWIVFSDNIYGSFFKPSTMDLIPESDWTSPIGGYDPNFITCTNVPYADIVVTDMNLAIIKTHKI